MKRIVQILISAVVTIGLAYVFVEYGGKSIGFFSDTEISFFRDYLNKTPKFVNECGLVTKIEPELIGSEKENVEGMQKGIYRFRVTTEQCIATIEFDWQKDQQETIVVSKYNIINNKRTH
jgi:hypothetical protein